MDAPGGEQVLTPAPVKCIDLELTDLGLQVLTFKPGFKEALSGEQGLGGASALQGQDLRAEASIYLTC